MGKKSDIAIYLKSPINFNPRLNNEIVYFINANGYVRKKNVSGFLHRGNPPSNKEDLEMCLDVIYKDFVLNCNEFIYSSQGPGSRNKLKLTNNLVEDAITNRRFSNFELGFSKKLKNKLEFIFYSEGFNDHAMIKERYKKELPVFKDFYLYFGETNEGFIKEIKKAIMASDQSFKLMDSIKKYANSIFLELKELDKAGGEDIDNYAKAGEWGF